MSSPFQKAFSAKSPLAKHDPKAVKALQARLAKVNKGEEGAEGQDGVDYELQAKIEGKIKEAKSDHKSSKKPLPIDDKNSYDYDYDQNEDITTAKKAPLKKNYSPLERGGYVGGGMSANDYASTADLYQNMFNKVESGTKQFMEGQADVEARAESGEAKAMRRDRKFKKKGSKMSKEKQAKFNEKTDRVSEKAADFRSLANDKQQRAVDLANSTNSTKSKPPVTSPPATPPAANQPVAGNAFSKLFNIVQGYTQDLQQKAVVDLNKAIDPNQKNQIQDKTT